MARKRKLVAMIRIDAPWPEGANDLSDALNRLLHPIWYGDNLIKVVMAYEPQNS